MNNSIELATRIRQLAIKMVHAANASHIGGALSAADLLAVLYGNVLNLRPDHPQWPDRDRFIFSKGHACSSLYAALAYRGFFPEKQLDGFGQNGSVFMTHASHHVPGVEFSTGSLGHGLPFACGKALAAKRQGRKWRVFALLSDGEMQEGSNWEALLFAAHHRLDNLTVVIDYNKIQSLGRVADILGLEPLAAKIAAFGWSAQEADGHDHCQLLRHLSTVPWESGKPSCLIAHTIKGKGVPFMEEKVEWHYKSPNGEQASQAIEQLENTSHA